MGKDFGAVSIKPLIGKKSLQDNIAVIDSLILAWHENGQKDLVITPLITHLVYECDLDYDALAEWNQMGEFNAAKNAATVSVVGQKIVQDGSKQDHSFNETFMDWLNELESKFEDLFEDEEEDEGFGY